ncbi:MAG: PAS domain-containing sensor histidine kinase [Anaerolineae bacterium]|nr:PAS domain-containing sensor histidine kinase [Anaerolineae bacterium]
MARQRRRWTALLARIADGGGLEVNALRQTRLHRAIRTRMELRRVQSLREYVHLLQATPGEYAALATSLRRTIRRPRRGLASAARAVRATLQHWVETLPLATLVGESLPTGRGMRVLNSNAAARELLQSPCTAVRSAGERSPWLNPDGTPCCEEELPLQRAIRQPTRWLSARFLLRDAADRLRPVVVETLRLPGRRPLALAAIRADAPGPSPGGRYQRLFEECPSPLILTTTDGRIIDVNARGRLLLQRSGAPLAGSSLSEHVTAESAPAVQQALDALALGEAEARLTMRAQPELTFEARVRALQEGEQTLVQWALHDVSFHLHTEQLRRDLVDLVLHDLRSPLATTLLGVEAAERNLQREDADRALRSLGTAGAALRRLTRLIDSLLDVSHLEAGQPIVRLQRVNPEELFQQIREEVQLALVAHRLQMEVELAPGLPTIVADGDMLYRAVLSLLDNAIKFSPAGSQIWVRVGAQDYGLLITVTDQGPGIPRELQPRIFDKFIGLQLPHGPRSYGLGLAFCKLAVEAHRGWVAVDSTPGEGSTFVLWIPANPELPEGT